MKVVSFTEFRKRLEVLILPSKAHRSMSLVTERQRKLFRGIPRITWSARLAPGARERRQQGILNERRSSR
jgi:hypothetical protein